MKYIDSMFNLFNSLFNPKNVQSKELTLEQTECVDLAKDEQDSDCHSSKQDMSEVPLRLHYSPEEQGFWKFKGVERLGPWVYFPGTEIKPQPIISAFPKINVEGKDLEHDLKAVCKQIKSRIKFRSKDVIYEIKRKMNDVSLRAPLIQYFIDSAIRFDYDSIFTGALTLSSKYDRYVDKETIYNWRKNYWTHARDFQLTINKEEDRDKNVTHVSESLQEINRMKREYRDFMDNLYPPEQNREANKLCHEKRNFILSWEEKIVLKWLGTALWTTLRISSNYLERIKASYQHIVVPEYFQDDIDVELTGTPKPYEVRDTYGFLTSSFKTPDSIWQEEIDRQWRMNFLLADENEIDLREEYENRCEQALKILKKEIKKRLNSGESYMILNADNYAGYYAFGDESHESWNKRVKTLANEFNISKSDLELHISLFAESLQRKGN